MTKEEQAVLGANEAFYKAFTSQDMQALEGVLAADHEITVIHPGWPAITGRRSVLSSWKRIMEGGLSPSVSCFDASAQIMGDIAIVICTEMLDEGELVATNIFVLEQGGWKMIHHQAGPLPQPESNFETGTLH